MAFYRYYNLSLILLLLFWLLIHLLKQRVKNKLSSIITLPGPLRKSDKSYQVHAWLLSLILLLQWKFIFAFTSGFFLGHNLPAKKKLAFNNRYTFFCWWRYKTFFYFVFAVALWPSCIMANMIKWFILLVLNYCKLHFCMREQIWVRLIGLHIIWKSQILVFFVSSLEQKFRSLFCLLFQSISFLINP